MEQSSHYSLVIADDHPLVRVGIKSYLFSEPKFRIVGEASNGLEALDLIETLSPDIAVIDIVMPHLDGVSLTKQLQEKNLKSKVLLITALEEFIDVSDAFFSGADGIISKSVSQEVFINTLEQIASGKKVYCKAIFQLLFDNNRYTRTSKDLVNFSKLQQKIISRRMRGYLFSEIAQELNLSIPEIASEVSCILETLDDYEFIINSISH
ncbi:MAG: response regulator transcription factor [Ignavibacteria bacterium]|nr:response regulator transcription factor [Ignavibacteria bacterium]